MRRSLALLFIFCVVAALPAVAAVSVPISTVEEIATRQSVGVASAYFGPALPAAEHGNSVTIQPAAGAYGSDGTLVGLSAVWHTSRIVPWNAGLSVGVLDLDVNTWTIAMSSGTEVWRGGRSNLVLEAVAGYQFFVDGVDTYTAFQFGNPDSGTGEEVLVDSFRLFHVMAHAVYSIDVWYFTPMIELGFVANGYRVDGHVWDGSFPVTDGEARSDSGATASIPLGIGASLNAGSAVLFGGMKLVADGAFFQVNVGLAF